MNKSIAQQPSDWVTYVRLLSYVKPYWLAFFISVVGFGLYAGSQGAIAGLMGYLIEVLKEGHSDNSVAQLVTLLGLAGPHVLIPILAVIIVIFRGAGTFLGNYYIAYVARHVVHDLRFSLFSHLIALPSSFYDANSSGHLISRITYNVEQVTGAATEAIKVVIREGITVIVLMTILLIISWQLALIFLATAPFIGLVVNFANKRFRKLSRRIQNSMGDVTHIASEAIQGYRIMRIFGGEKYEKERFHAASDYNLRQSMKLAITRAISTPVVQLIIVIALAFLMWLALKEVLFGDVSAEKFITFLTAAGLMPKPIRQLTEVNATIQKGLAAVQSVFSIIDTEPEINKGQVNAERVEGKVEFNNVQFAYNPQQENVLKRISFTIEPGQTVALVGRSGSGKSTLASLIPRFYNHTYGDILIDDKPIQDYELASLREQIALVTQQVVLFNDTIAKNIAYGSLENTSEADILEVARVAHALEFIKKMPKGIHTLVGDNGVLLSGGQRQRLAIARALLKDAPILILDEATSALDTESERHIQAALDAVMQGRTTLVIAHRLSTIEGADLIMVMDQGEILEKGTHRQLLALGKHYAQLYRLQFQNETIG